MVARPAQGSLFEPAPLPPDLIYQPGFITPAEEAALLTEIVRQPFREAHYQQFTARRRVVLFGQADYPSSYGPVAGDENSRETIPKFLVPLRRRVAQWLAMDESAFVHALLTEYRPGTPIGWHSDAPHFDITVGISLASATRMRFRPYAAQHDKKATIAVELERRSAYVLQGEVRRHWQHHIPAVKQLRYSITFRTLVNPNPGKPPMNAD